MMFRKEILFNLTSDKLSPANMEGASKQGLLSNLAQGDTMITVQWNRCMRKFYEIYIWHAHGTFWISMLRPGDYLTISYEI